MTLDTVADRRADARAAAAGQGTRPGRRRVRSQIREILGRRPTSSELAIYSVMWSEHCSYKSSKVHLRQFGEKAPKTDALLVGMGENAGVVDVGDGWAVTFKIESHNHPSYVEPYQGAATGVGGIVRDILTMGARPVARDGLAALRPARRARHRARAARRGRRHRRLRQLPRPAERRRRGVLRRVATPATRWSTRCASA